MLEMETNVHDAVVVPNLITKLPLGLKQGPETMTVLPEMPALAEWVDSTTGPQPHAQLTSTGTELEAPLEVVATTETVRGSDAGGTTA